MNGCKMQPAFCAVLLIVLLGTSATLADTFSFWSSPNLSPQYSGSGNRNASYQLQNQAQDSTFNIRNGTDSVYFNHRLIAQASADAGVVGNASARLQGNVIFNFNLPNTVAVWDVDVWYDYYGVVANDGPNTEAFAATVSPIGNGVVSALGGTSAPGGMRTSDGAYTFDSTRSEQVNKISGLGASGSISFPINLFAKSDYSFPTGGGEAYTGLGQMASMGSFDLDNTYYSSGHGLQMNLTFTPHLNLSGHNFIAPLDLVSGEMLTGFGTVNGNISGVAGSEINSTGGSLTIGTPSSSSGFSTDGTVEVSGGILTLDDANAAVVGGTTQIFAGTLKAPNGLENNGSLKLAGGMLDIGPLTGTGTLNWTQGTLQTTGAVGIGPTQVLGSSVTLSANKKLKASTATVKGGGQLRVEQAGVVLSPTSVILEGGTLIGNTAAAMNDLSVTWNSGTIKQEADDFDVSSSGPLGNTINIGAGQKLETTESIAIAATSTLILGGGEIKTKSLVGDGTFTWTSGTLEWTGTGTDRPRVATGSILGASLNIDATKTLKVDDIVVESGGDLAISGGTITGGVTIDGGQFSSPTLGGITFAFIAGTLSVTDTGATTTIDTGEPLGASLVLQADRTLNVAGTLAVATGAELTLDGGKLVVKNMDIQGTFSFDDGTLELAGGSVAGLSALTVPTGGALTGHGNLAAEINGLSGSVISASGGTLSLGDASSFLGFRHEGTLEVGSATVSLSSAGFAQLGPLTTIDGGILAAPSGVLLGAGDSLSGSGSVAGRIYAEYGSRIVATGDLTLGDASSYTGFFNDGNLEVGIHNVSIQSKATAALGKLVSIDGGTLVVANGMIVEPGCRLVGEGTIDGPFINQGLVAAGSPGEDLTFNDLVSGAGSFTGSIIFNGGFSPGNSPAVQHLDWATMTENNILTMEIGGLLAGVEYDQLIGNESLTLGGTLNVELINGFMPEYGNAFTLFDGPLTGQFDDILLPELGPGLQWYDSQLTTTGLLLVTTNGDIDSDGDVDSADLNLLLSSFDTPPSTLDQANLDALLGNFGRTDMATSKPVPEPHTALLLAMGMIGLVMRFRKRGK